MDYLCAFTIVIFILISVYFAYIYYNTYYQDNFIGWRPEYTYGKHHPITRSLNNNRCHNMCNNPVVKKSTHRNYPSCVSACMKKIK